MKNWREFKFISENTLEYLVLHDCTIEHAAFDGSSLICEMDFIDVLPEHPLNNFLVAKCTGEAVLVFEDVVVLESIVFDTSNAKGVDLSKEAIKVTIPIIEAADKFLILESTCISSEENNYIYRFFGDVYPHNKRKCTDFGNYNIQFSKVYVCWNELEDDSWFVNWPPK